MNIGKMRHPVTIRALQPTQDPVTGEMGEGWADLATVWGSIDSVTGREFMAASAEQATTTHRITIYYRDDLKPDMRLFSAPVEYQIKAILPNNDRSLISIMCEVME
ncbi:phage head closure protein [Marinobacter sp.]|jgi:SPP1 family predicted phage head-tail adaptor|uniref:phage head closure protein n=1 Tax=Marinobacter sp. TaxID=50741 RepID=UPI000C51AC10|nr:phage head closure protein [Marinobacter sp.]MAO13712.1 head-tail adaptor protein [Marinobacter sp.]|tara:strand:+ start:1633 stop:1950 length:318 start_codon:yes stop_codon:yes gene_type:complete